MTLRKTAAFYTIIVAIAMFGLWVMLLASGAVEELDDTPQEVVYHLAAGMLLYTVIVSAGY